jgi:apolipoprotein N-acyltransferase
MGILREQTAKHWDKDLIIWPEAAVPLMYHDALNFLSDIGAEAAATNTGIITGILYDDPEVYAFYNSIIGIGRADGIYFKQRLVPFGEYVPLEKWLRGIIAFFDLPNSIIFPGPREQAILSFEGFNIAPSICYEIVYPDLVARLAQDAALLVTISNDAWFGQSIGPKQHFQMARMRALENRRYLLRATNTGISGIIDPQGQIKVLAPPYRQGSAAGADIKLLTERTVFSYLGSWPIIVLCLALLLAPRVGPVRPWLHAQSDRAGGEGL